MNSSFTFGSTLALALLTGCNVFLDLETSQCSTDRDCAVLGAEFSGMVCRAGSCMAPTTTAGSNQSGEGSNGGSGQSGATSGCTSNAQCVADNLDEPYACLVPGEACVPLTTEECPVVFGDYKYENAVYFGALLEAPPTAPLSQMSTLNVRLAVDEFNRSVGGLPGGPLGKLRPLVTVVCRNEPALVDAAAEHLIDRVKVPAILSHLASGDNKRLFSNHALPKQVLVMNPGFADNSLTSISSGGLFWHMIGDIRDVAPAYVPLLARVESYLASPEPLRVAMLVSKRYTEESIANTLTPLLRFNGKSVVENGSNFFSAAVTALSDDRDADYATVNQSLLAFKPNVIIAITREELVHKILPAVESGWSAAAPGQRRPFYILPTALSGNRDLLNYVAMDTGANTSEVKRKRFVGVAPASAENMTLYDQFLVRFRTAYPHFENPAGFENFYDAVYLLGNAMFAAGSVPSLTGADVARGMQRVVNGNITVDIGPTFIADGFAALAAGGSVRINGTMGPADFDPGVGARRSNGSIYCIQRNAEQLSFAYDVLRFDQGSTSLSGEFPCFPNF